MTLPNAIVTDLEKHLIVAVNESYSSIPDNIHQLYKGDVDMERLKCPLQDVTRFDQTNGQNVEIAI